MGGLTFQPELAKAVMAGTKTVTRRRLSDNPNSPWWREECGFKVGKHYAIQPGRGKPQIGRAFVTVVVKQGLWSVLSDEMARAEGVADLEAFKAVWRELHGSYDPDETVWAVHLERRLRYRVFIPRAPRHNETAPASDLEEVARLLRRWTRDWAIDNLDGTRLSLADVRRRV